MSSAKVVLVTGCSTGGIGYAMCEKFAERGCRVYATSRNIETVREFRDSSIERLALDVTKEDDIENVIQHILKIEGRVDIVVNNAGALCVGPLIEIPMEQVKHAFELNTFAALRLARTVIPAMAKRKTGVIVNIGSVVGEIPTPWNGVYSASKAALHAITEVLSMEAKPFNISIMLVSPGSIKSNISKNSALNFQLLPKSLYSTYIKNIFYRMNVSQGPHAMPTDVCAQQIVNNALRAQPPTYITLGGHSRTFAFFKWLPRAWVLWFMWRIYSKRL